MIWPGSAPMYVRRWPRISASSRMPPSDTRTNLRPSDCAIDFASDVLPTPGGPTKQRIGPFTLGIQLADRQVLENPVLGLFQARMIGVEHRLGLRQVDDLVGPLVPRQRDQPVDVGARDGVLGGRGRHLRQAVELAKRFLLDRLGHAGRFDLLGELLDFLGLIVALAELLLNRLHLLAQEVLALVPPHFGLHLRLNLRIRARAPRAP